MPSIIKNGRIYNASAASEITYNNTSSGLVAENTQAAIDEVNGKIPVVPDHYDADDIVYDNTSSELVSTDVQSAIDEIVENMGGGTAEDITFDDTHVPYEADDVQEALEKVTKSLTYAEYEALTDAEKNNGTIYLITDVNGDGQSFQPVIYSEEEREIGVWINGKPLYQKTLHIQPTEDTADYTNFETVTNIENVVVNNFLAKRVSASDVWIYTGNGSTLPESVSYNQYKIGVRVYNNNLQYYISGYGAQITDIWVTIQYTKTTDTAGSGTWTPQGVPSVHYSADEQVVGTWIDGSTIYEKTFNLQSEISLDTSNWTSLGVSLSGVDTPISIEARSSRAINSSVVVDVFDSPMTAKGLDKIKSLTIRYTKATS